MRSGGHFLFLKLLWIKDWLKISLFTRYFHNHRHEFLPSIEIMTRKKQHSSLALERLQKVFNVEF